MDEGPRGAMFFRPFEQILTEIEAESEEPLLLVQVTSVKSNHLRGLYFIKRRHLPPKTGLLGALDVP